MLNINILTPTAIEATERMTKDIGRDMNLTLSGTVFLRRTSYAQH